MADESFQADPEQVEKLSEIATAMEMAGLDRLFVFSAVKAAVFYRDVHNLVMLWPEADAEKRAEVVAGLERAIRDLKPKSTGAPPKEVTLTGKVFPWIDDRPVLLLGMPGTDMLYLPVFSDEASLREIMKLANSSFTSIKHIDDGREFLESLPGYGTDYVLAVDIEVTKRGTFRFQQIAPD